MKRLALVLLAVVLAIPAFQSCKKGENDPAISLKSRDARITATWKLTKIEGTKTSVNSGVTTTTTTTYDGSIKTRVTTIPGFPTVTSSVTGTFEMTIDKKGRMSWTETVTSVSPPITDVQSGEGNWYWLNSDKDKSVVYLLGGYTFFYGGNCVLDRLASKELIIIDEHTTNNNGDVTTETVKYTFEV
jgi:hypothetical protein